MSDLLPCDRDQEAWALALRAHLPPGDAAADFRTPGGHPGWMVMRWFAGVAADVASYNCRFHAALIPDQGLDMLALHERTVGLPDSCAPSFPEYPQSRLDAVLGKWRQRGATQFAEFESLARGYGYDIAITGHRIWDVCGNTVAEHLDAAPYWVEILIRDVPVYLWTVCDNTIDQSLGDFDTQLIRCILEREMPSHWQLTFVATGVLQV